MSRTGWTALLVIGLTAVIALMLVDVAWCARAVPNVLVFVADDVGRGDIQALGGQVATPNLDRLLSDSMDFTDAHTPAASCHPTRFALVTGSNAYRTRARYGFSGARGNALTSAGRTWNTLGDVMKGPTDEQGESIYATSFIGKIHLGLPRLAEHGYDHVYGLPTGGQAETNMIIDGNADLITDDEGTLLSDGLFPGRPPVWEEMSPLGGILAEQGRAFIETNAAVNRPFFLQFNSHPLHSPHVPPRTFSTYDGTEEPVYPFNDINGDPLTPVGASLRELDLQVGYLLDTLEAEGIAEETLVIFTSDNGAAYSLPNLRRHMPDGHHSAGSIPDSSGNLQPLRTGKLDMWEAGHRVPFFVKWGDGTPQGSVIQPGVNNEQLVTTTDLMATLHDLTGQAIEADEAMDSVSLLPTFFDTSESVRSEMYLQAGPHPANNLAASWRMDDAEGEWVLLLEQTVAGRNDWFLIGEADELEAAELYNLTDDPGQHNDLLSTNIRINADETPWQEDLAAIPDESIRQRTSTMMEAFFSYWEPRDPRTTAAVDFSLVENQTSIPLLPGDIDADGDCDVDDIESLSRAIREGQTEIRMDLNQDGHVDGQDRSHWVRVVKESVFGDANLDGHFDSTDLIQVFEAGEYEDATASNSDWSEGDWNGDAEFTTADLVFVLAQGGYEPERSAEISAVPEPATLWMSGVAWIGLAICRKRVHNRRFC